jgi:hypothetical protein
MGVGVVLANSVLTYILKSGSISCYVSLHTDEPQPLIATPDLHEVTGSAYAREPLTGTDWAAAADGMIETDNAVTFPPAGASWGTVTHVGIYDALTSGNLLWWGPLATPRAVSSGDTISFPVGNLSGRVPQ